MPKNKQFTIVAKHEHAIKRAIRVLENFSGASEDNPVEIVIRPYKKDRTREQNALFHVWMHYIGEATGQPSEEVKFFIKKKFLAPILVRDDMAYREMSLDLKLLKTRGEVQLANNLSKRLISKLKTSELNVKQFTELMGKIQLWAIDFFGAELPETRDYEEGVFSEN